MGKEEYLQQLKKNLINMDETEKEDAVRYYQEYFEDAGPENEQKIIDELGSPVMLARKLSAECAIKELGELSSDFLSSNHEKTQDVNSGASPEDSEPGTGGTYEYIHETKGRTGINILTIILAICSFPVWFPLGITLAILVFVVILLAFIFTFCFIIAGISLLLSGIVGIISGIALLFSSVADALTVFGSGMAFTGIGILFFILGRFLTRQVVEAIVTVGKKKISKM